MVGRALTQSRKGAKIGLKNVFANFASLRELLLDQHVNNQRQEEQHQVHAGVLVHLPGGLVAG